MERKPRPECRIDPDTPFCRYCLSFNIACDATVSYNPIARKWEVEDIQGNSWCYDCGSEMKWAEDIRSLVSGR